MVLLQQPQLGPVIHSYSQVVAKQSRNDAYELTSASCKSHTSEDWLPRFFIIFISVNGHCLKQLLNRGEEENMGQLFV